MGREEMRSIKAIVGTALLGLLLVAASRGWIPPLALAVTAAATSTWTTAASMPTARYGLAAATSSDGRIYAIGGFDGASYPSVVQVYDPTTSTWTSGAPMPTARIGL